jgi:hypothetical protein
VVDGLTDDPVDELDDRGVVGLVAQIVHAASGEVLVIDDADDVVDAVGAREELLNLFFGCTCRTDRMAADDLQIVDALEVGGIHHRHHKHAVRIEAHRDRLVAACGLLIDERGDRRVHPVLRVEHAHAHLQRHRSVDLIARHLAGGHQDLTKFASVGRLAGKCRLDVLGLYEAKSNQGFTERHATHLRGPCCGGCSGQKAFRHRRSLRRLAGHAGTTGRPGCR